jgi:hypothetical protein
MPHSPGFDGGGTVSVAWNQFRFRMGKMSTVAASSVAASVKPAVVIVRVVSRTIPSLYFLIMDFLQS